MLQDTGSPDDEIIHDWCAAIHWLLYLSGLDEVEMPIEISAVHQSLNADQCLYLAVWERLDSKTRAAFKAWLTYEYTGQSSRESSSLLGDERSIQRRVKSRCSED